MHRPARLSFSALLLALAATFASCSKPARTDVIHVRDDAGFDSWIADHQSVLSADDVRELNDARQLLRFKAMQAHRGMSSEELANEVYADIDGKTAHDLLVTRCELQLERLRAELKDYDPMVQKFQNAKNDLALNDDQKQYADEQLQRIARLQQEHRDQIAAFEKRLAELKQEPAK